MGVLMGCFDSGQRSVAEGDALSLCFEFCRLQNAIRTSRRTASIVFRSPYGVDENVSKLALNLAP